MTVEEKIREIMISKELSNGEKLDRLHTFSIPAIARKGQHIKARQNRF